MNTDPIPGLSDKRYFHVALLLIKKDFQMDWLWANLRKDCKLSRGRFGRDDVPASLEFRTVQASSSYASAGSREALAISKDSEECAYDVFSGVAKDILVFGTGYAALTRHLIARLVHRGLVTHARFMIPKLHDIVEFCRSENEGSKKLSMKYTVTGFNAFIPGVKNLRQIRLSGTDVFNSGLVEEIERWLQTRSPKEPPKVDVPNSGDDSLQYLAIRVKAMGAMTGSAASISLAQDGTYKIWLRQRAANLPTFVDAVSGLRRIDKFETTTQPPSWSEENEV